MIELLHEDNMVVMSRYPDNYFDLAIVDPPYGIKVNMNMGKKKGEKARYEKKGWDGEIPPEEYFIELERVSKNRIIWGGNYFTDYLHPSMGWVLWDKDVPDGVSFSDFEMAWTSFNMAAKKVKIPYCGFIGVDTKRIHPTEKPKRLYKWLLDKYAKVGDKILDTHLGSGSIAIACHEYGFDLTACEIDKDYYDASVKRFNLVTSQTQLFKAS